MDALLQHSKEMLEAVQNKIGPDIVIVVSTSDSQAQFWQERLTKDGIYGLGDVVKETAVVLSVSEENWSGRAGNALGTLNAIIQAMNKACELGIIFQKGDSISHAVQIFFEYSKNKSVFMYHQAGKGTRVAPLQLSELNAKSNIKLPKILSFKNGREPITILESILIETSIYAPSRKNRLSVFWGDQIIINENSIDFAGEHHVEIFGQCVELTKDIESYGILIPDSLGNCKQREKFPLEEIRKILPKGAKEVFKSIGSFSISFQLLEAFFSMKYHNNCLINEKGTLGTDADWWQALTSEKDEYCQIMQRKNIAFEESSRWWEKMQRVWFSFAKRDEKLLCVRDVGKNALWWDYGQNKYYMKNIMLLTTNSFEGDVARTFFGIKNAIDSYSHVGKTTINNTLVLDSTIENGKLENCIVVSSKLKNVFAKNSIIISSSIIELRAEESLCYNVIDSQVNLQKDEILTHIFHLQKGKFPMRTFRIRNGQQDWESIVCGNPYSYSEIIDLVADMRFEDVKKIRRSEASRLFEKL